MFKKIIFMAFSACLMSSSAFAFLTPKLLAKFAYGHNIRGENAKSNKLGGGLAFELEIIKYFSAGLFLNGSCANIQNLTLQTDEPLNDKRADVKALLVDAGLYLKPQLPISLGPITLAPYFSFGIGFPSFSAIRGAYKEAYKNNLVISQFYSGLFGVDLTLADSFIILAEAGVATNLRFYKPYFMLVPFSANVGIGYRF